jgi:hypothetical protein
MMRTFVTASVLGATLAGTLWSSSSMAQVRYLDPDTLPPAERQFALHGPIGEVGPSGRAAPVGCRWSRLQLPSAKGVRWFIQEDCSDNQDGR